MKIKHLIIATVSVTFLIATIVLLLNKEPVSEYLNRILIESKSGIIASIVLASLSSLLFLFSVKIPKR